MKISKQDKRAMLEWIDGASYEELLRRWRHSADGDPIFQGEIGRHYSKVLTQRRAEMSDPVATSKKIGW